MRQALLASALLASLVAASLSGAQAVPDGWKALDARTFSPTDLSPGETMKLAFLTDGSLGGKSVTDWLMANAPKDFGEAGATPRILNQSEQAALVALQKGSLSYIYTAVAQGERVRWMRIVMSGGDAMQRYNPAVKIFSARLLAPAAPTAAPSGAGTGKLKLGGPIQEGIYQGEQTYGGKHRTRFKLWLYADGEYRIVDLEGVEDDRDGRYEYDAKTGALQISRLHWLNTNDRDPKDAMCVFVHDEKGRPMVYANNDRGISRAVTSLFYAGKVDRPSPEKETAAKAAAKAEAARYKFVVAPGKGLGTQGVAAIVHDLKVKTVGNGAEQINRVTILLKDGTAYDGFPAPLEAWDVPTSRRREPAKWGRWKRAGAGYQVAYGGAYRPLPGRAVRPAAPGLRLDGRWGTGESWGDMISGTSYRLWGIAFTKDGRFVRDERGGAGTSNFMATGTGTSINTQYDDDGSYTGAVTPGAVVGVKGKPRNPLDHRSGTYRFEGYTLVLSYGDGRVERHPFFFTPKSPVPDLYFTGKIMEKDEPKKR